MKSARRLALALTILASTAILASGCSDLLGKLRPDLDDSGSGGPTTGGLWSERGFLSDSPPEHGDRYDYVGHSERGPASDGGAARGGDSWVDADRAAADRRDEVRGNLDGDGGDQISYGNTPNLPPSTRRMYKSNNRATRADFIDDSQSEGSLWASDGQTNFYFTKNKVHAVGDILTLKLGQDLIRDIGLEVKRTLNDSERATELALAEERAQARAQAQQQAAGGGKDSVTSSQAAPGADSGSSTSNPGGPSADVQPSDIDVSKSLELKPGDTMMVEIVQRYPNGNYKIRGTKRVMYKNGAPRLVNLTAVVRASDVGEDDTVDSGKLYEYRLQATRY